MRQSSDHFPKEMPTAPSCGTRDCSLYFSGGKAVSKEITLSGVGAQTDNLFQVTGTVRVLGIYLVVTEATDSTTVTNTAFETDDGAAQSAITAVQNLSGVVAGALAYKSGNFAAALDLLDAAAGAVDEVANNKVMYEFVMVQKTAGVATYVRLKYTGDAATDVDICAVIRYQPLTSASVIVAV